jgi:amino acid transporter
MARLTDLNLSARQPVFSQAPGSPHEGGHGFGTAPVFLASISTILGAILFLRFGYAVANVGLWGTMLVILMGHLVTIPTVLAVSEIATNRRVAGGGAYFIISRSFGTSIGGAIGVALYLSQAISIAFYLVAFAEAFAPVFALITAHYGYPVDARWVSVPSTVFLLALMLKKGADLGVQALWVVCVILGLSLLAFFAGTGPLEIRPEGLNLTAHVASPDSFSKVFAICFPAFTGMIAGLGLSGDLKNPQKSIPLGTTAATLAGMVVYALVAIKLAENATPEALNSDQFIMTQIAIWGPAIYIGLGAAALSSALGSILVAPRTLQALAKDGVLPTPKLNSLMARGKGGADEPVNAALVSGAMALFFVLIGDVNSISQVLSMFFMVTYGALCAVSFLEYFAGNPSYRPTFRSRWYVSLLGAVMCALMMIQMSAFYAFLSVGLMILIYAGLRHTRTEERGLAAIFLGTMFQLTRRLQISLQKSRTTSESSDWRPSVVAMTRHGEKRLGHFDLMRWICQRHGFGHFIQYIQGEYSFEAEIRARVVAQGLVKRTQISRAGIFVDTLISPSYELALAQVLQLPGISGLPNNTVLFEFDRDHPEEVHEIAEGVKLATSSKFNVCVLRSTIYRFGYRSSIHIWLTDADYDNASLMILLSYILVGHPDWRHAEIQLFTCFAASKAEEERTRLEEMMREGRLPISSQKIAAVPFNEPSDVEVAVSRYSKDADLVIFGLNQADIEGDLASALGRNLSLNDVLFVNASDRISIL